jgi:hypothetical protein
MSNLPLGQLNAPTEDEFECDRCGNTQYALYLGIPTLDVTPYAQCVECGWMCPTVAPTPITQSIYQGFKPIPIAPCSCLYCKGAVDGCWQCNNTVAIASGGGVG